MPDPLPLKLLLVEDDAFIRRMYERLFTREGFAIFEAFDGTIVRETILLNRPDAIIMDVMMPNLNGLETLKELKSDPKTQGIPILMLSANSDPAIMQKALDFGAARYIVKDSVEPSELVTIIRSVIGVN